VRVNNGTVASGTTFLSWPTCSGLTFTSYTLTHLTLFPDGHGALWTGYGQYNLAPYAGDLNFTVYAIDGGVSGILGDYIHLRIFDKTGFVYLDTDPCSPAITSITVQPPVPNSYITAASTQGVTISNPSGSLVSAIAGESAMVGGVSVGAIVGITLGLVAFAVIAAGVVYYLLQRRIAASQGSAQQQFQAM